MESREGTSQGAAGGMSRLRMLQLQIADKLRNAYLRQERGSRENIVWTTLFQLWFNEVKEREASLERAYDNIGRNNELHLSQLDILIETLKNFSKCTTHRDEEIIRRQEDIKKDIQELEKKIAERTEILGTMNTNLKGLRRTKEELLKLRQTPEFTLLSNWVRDTCDKCIHLENEITETKLRIGQKNADVLELLGYGHNIFSKVSIEDLKKTHLFTTDAEPSTSSNMSFQ